VIARVYCRPADPLFMLQEPASVRRPGHTRHAADYAPIAEPPPGEELHHEQPRRLLANAAQL
jgi:hypothetical protein